MWRSCVDPTLTSDFRGSALGTNPLVNGGLSWKESFSALRNEGFVRCATVLMRVTRLERCARKSPKWGFFADDLVAEGIM